jgi:16S rRNA processing protein RimM
MECERVVIAEILRPRGLRGELLARSLSDVPGRFEARPQLQARLVDGSDVTVQIEEAWEHKELWVLKFSGVDSFEAADVFRKGELWVPIEQRAPLPSGEYFQADLAGCQVVDRSSGRALGVVQGWQQYGGPPLMEINFEGREVLIPFVDAFCQVDLAQRLVSVDLPAGLLDL